MSTIQADMSCTFDPSEKIEGILNSLNKQETDALMNELLSVENKIKKSDDVLNKLYPSEEITSADALAQYMSAFCSSCCCCDGIFSLESSLSIMGNNAFSPLVSAYHQG